MKLFITRHAKEKMDFHGISEEQIKIAIIRGAKIKQTEGYLAVYTYLRVAYKKMGEDCYKIKTIMVER